MSKLISKSRALLVTGILCCTLPSAATASIVNLNPVADAFVVAAQPNGNFGGAGGLSVAASGLPQGEFQSVVRFDTAAAKSSLDATYGAGQWTIQSMSLSLTATPPNNAIFNAPAAGQFNASWMQNDAGVEGTGMPNAPGATGVTFASLPSFLTGSDEALGTFAQPGSTSGVLTYNLALTPNMSLDAAAGNLLSLRLFAANASVSYLIRSRNVGAVADRPVLTITAVPEPSTLVLLAVTGIILAKKRRS